MLHESEALLNAKWKLIHAIYEHANFAAGFAMSASNYDRPIDHDEHGRAVYDPRWYAVVQAKTHFIEGLANAIDDELRAYTAVVAYAARSAEAEEGE